MLQYGTKIRLWIFPELLIFSPHTLWSAWLFYTCKQKGKQMDEQFMRKKAVLPLITSMALPMVLSMLVNALYNIVDSYFVARISENAMTALSLVYPLQNLVNAIAIGFGGILILTLWNGTLSINIGILWVPESRSARTRQPRRACCGRWCTGCCSPACVLPSFRCFCRRLPRIKQ